MMKGNIKLTFQLVMAEIMMLVTNRILISLGSDCHIGMETTFSNYPL